MINFDFEIVDFPFLDCDVPCSTSYGVYISQLIRFARASIPCADPCQAEEQNSVVFFCFFSPQLILQKSNGQFQRNILFFKVREGVRLFPGESNFFQGGGGGGVQFLIPYRNPYNL